LADRSIKTPQSPLTEFLTNIVSHGMARIAVPLFFLMSGYLFFLGFQWSWRNYGTKLRKRAGTLLVPYIFWNCFTLAVIGLAQAIPASRNYLSGRIPSIASFDVFDFINNIFGITVKPVAYQFWFIRDLMIMVLLSPLVYAALTLVPISYLTMLFLCWFLGLFPLTIPAGVAALFFSLGGYWALNNISLFAVDRYGVAIVTAYFPILVLDALFKDWPFSPYLHRLGILLGVAAALYVTKFVAKTDRLKRWLLTLASASFFIFVTHQPLLTVLRKALHVALAPATPLASLCLQFLIPIVLVAFLVLLYRVLLAVVPRFIRIVTGGR
jgi:surface polysaccharide O-acyltransferase-like enzyme